MIIEGNEAEVEGGTNGTQVTEDQKDINPELEPGGESDLNRGAEDQTVGEETHEVEGEVREENSVPEPQPALDPIKLKEEIVNDLKEALKPAEEPRKISEEEWAKYESEWGVPRQTIDRITRQTVKAVEEMRNYVDQKLASMEKDSKVASVARENGISDYQRLMPQVNDFLKAYDQKHHSNPLLLRQALFYARGVNAPKDIQKARTTDEKNRQVINRLKPSRSEGASGGSAPKGLSASEREAAEILGSEKEYLDIKNRKSKVIAF